MQQFIRELTAMPVGADLDDESYDEELDEDDLYDDEEFGEDPNVDGMFDDKLTPRELPVVRLPSRADLAADVRRTRCYAALTALVNFADGRKLTARDVLRRADAHEVVRTIDLGLSPEWRESALAARSALDIPALSRLWPLALEEELLVINRGRAVRGPNVALREEGDDEELLALWRAEADAALPGAPPDSNDLLVGSYPPVAAATMDFLLDRYAATRWGP